MRGVPRLAADRNLPIAGTRHRCGDIADRVNICPWNSDMYGVDMSKPGAQAYHDSVFRQIASRSEEHTTELQSLKRISYAAFCLKKKIHLDLLNHILVKL